MFLTAIDHAVSVTPVQRYMQYYIVETRNDLKLRSKALVCECYGGNNARATSNESYLIFRAVFRTVPKLI